jgi:hypothetical protein
MFGLIFRSPELFIAERAYSVFIFGSGFVSYSTAFSRAIFFCPFPGGGRFYSFSAYFALDDHISAQVQCLAYRLQLPLFIRFTSGIVRFLAIFPQKGRQKKADLVISN